MAWTDDRESLATVGMYIALLTAKIHLPYTRPAVALEEKLR
jgi:hypothetical protein